MKFWIANDLGADFSKGQMDWAVLTFDKAMTKEQRDAVAEIMGTRLPGEVELVHHRRGEHRQVGVRQGHRPRDPGRRQVAAR